MQCPSYHVIPCVCSLLTAQSGQEGQRGDAELERTCRWQSHGFWPWWWERQGNGQCQERRELLRTRGCLRLVSARQYPSARLNTLQDAALALSSHTACAREHSREHKMRFDAAPVPRRRSERVEAEPRPCAVVLPLHGSSQMRARENDSFAVVRNTASQYRIARTPDHATVSLSAAQRTVDTRTCLSTSYRW